MSGSLLELVENELESDNSWEYSSIGRGYLGTAKSTDGVAVVKVLVETSYPFASGDRISESSSKTGGTELRERGNGEQFRDECRIVIGTLEEGQIKKFISEVGIDGWIKAVDVEAEAEDRSERSMVSHLEIQDIRYNVCSSEATEEKREASGASVQVFGSTRVDIIENICNLGD
jgi:hypothetical protein